MKAYRVFREKGRSRELEHIYDFKPIFDVPQRGDHMEDPSGLMWVVERRQWAADGNPFLVVSQKHGPLVPA